MTNIDEQQAKKLKIAEVQPPLATKKPRALPHVWARFYEVGTGKTFFTPNGDKAIKVNFFGFRRYARPACFVNDWGKQSRFEFIAPWTRVKTDVLIRDARPGGKSSLPAFDNSNSFDRRSSYASRPRDIYRDSAGVLSQRNGPGHEGAVPHKVSVNGFSGFSREVVDGLNAPSLGNIQTGPSA